MAYCTELDEQKLVLASLHKHFVQLGTNVIGARTVETVLQTFPKTLTNALRAEFYGPHFTILLPETPRNLRSVIEGLPAKEGMVCDRTLMKK